MGMSFSVIEKSATRKCAFKDLKLAERKWTASSRIRAVLVIKVHYCSGVSCPHIESLPTLSAVEAIRRPYISSNIESVLGLYLAHSFSVRLVTSDEAIRNRRNDRIVARTLTLCPC